MQERIIEIIVYLLGEFKHEQPKQGSYTDLSKELLSRGYTETEITFAFSWIFNYLQKNDRKEQPEFSYGNGSIRVLHDLERLVMTPEAYGYLLQMWHLGLITESELEDLIEKSLSLGSTNVTLEDIKSIAASIIFSSENSQHYDGFFYYPGTNTIH